MALPLRGEVADVWWTDLLLGDHVGVEHVDDEVSHARLALWPMAERSDMGGLVLRWRPMA